MSQLNIKVSGDLRVKRQLAALSLPATKRKNLHRQIAREVQRKSRQRIKEQRDVNGQQLTPRKQGKKKMFRRLMRGSNTKIYTGSNKATLTWPNGLTGKIARIHQEGLTETVTAQDMQRKHGTPDYSAPATAQQAKALIKEGYRLPGGKYKSGQKKGKTKTRRVSQKWIQENLTRGQAGLVLRILQEREPVKSWDIETPEREFFGLSKNDVSQLASTLIDDMTGAVKRAR